MPPSLETERLTLTAHTLADFEECAAMWADAAVTRFIGGRPASREDVWNRILRYRGLWSLLGFGYWAVNERETGRYVGDVGFADFHRDLTPSLNGAPEVGWALATWAHGRGFATEAVRAAIAWGDTHIETATAAPSPAATATIETGTLPVVKPAAAPVAVAPVATAVPAFAPPAVPAAAPAPVVAPQAAAVVPVADQALAAANKAAAAAERAAAAAERAAAAATAAEKASSARQ